MDDDEPDSTIVLVNSSDERIVFYEEYRLPLDTSIATIAFPQTPANTEERIIESNTTFNNVGPFKSLFRQLPNRELKLYLLSRDTIEQVPWEEIVERSLVLRRYDLTEQDLDSLDWRVEYP